MIDRPAPVLLCLTLLSMALSASIASADQDVGEACGVVAGGKKCGKGLSCTVLGICKRDSGGRKGEGCGMGFECGKGLTCEAGSQKCVGKGKEGDSCHATRLCKKGLSCAAGSQTCVAPGEEGDPCHATRPCDDGLSCEAGSQRCVGPGNVGDPCHATRPCKSRLSCAPGSQRCYHKPREAGEPCSAGFDCGKGLTCEAGSQRCLVARKACSACSEDSQCDSPWKCTDGRCRGKVFDIKVVWADSPKGVKSPSKALKDSMEAAVARWRRVIREHLKTKTVTMPTDLTGISVPDWMSPYVAGKSWDDLMIVARVAGPKQGKDFKKKSTTLAVANTVWRDADDMPRLGLIEVSESKMESDLAKYVEETLMHEIGHVLGFDSDMFERKNLLSGNRKFFVGPRAIAAYKELGGTGGIELQWDKKAGMTPGSHWSEGSLGEEMMTPSHDAVDFAGAGWSASPLSRISLAALEDMGYAVAHCEAQDFKVSADAVSGPEYRPPPEKPNPLPGSWFHLYFDETVLEVGSGPWGFDRAMAFCPYGTYASGFSLRVEPKNEKDGDDTALNSVRLICTGTWSNQPIVVQSHPGYWGDWGPVVSCTTDKYLKGANIRIEGKQKKKDDTAANDVKFVCDDGTELKSPNGGPWGEWQKETVSCPDDEKVCGVQIKLEGRQGPDDDDTAMNGLTLACCY